MNNAGDAVLLSYGILAGVAWLWFTRRWSVAWQVSLLLAFGLIWIALTFNTTHDSRYDPDLGVRLSSLTIPDAAFWSLPLAIALWMPVVAVVLFARRLVRRRSPSPQPSAPADSGGASLRMLSVNGPARLRFALAE